MTSDRIRIFHNTNAKMSSGKLAAHAAHAVLRAAGIHPGIPIVVLGGKPRDIVEMRTFIRDEGRTELEPGTVTTGTDFIFPSPPRDRVEEAVNAVAAHTGLGIHRDPGLERSRAAVDALIRLGWRPTANTEP